MSSATSTTAKQSEEEKKQKQRTYQKQWEAENREKVRATKKRWRDKNPDYGKAATKRWRDKNPDKIHAARIRECVKRYGVDKDDILASQGNVCAICRTDTPSSKTGWHVDHCHETKKVRGVLCQHCNNMLGYARDNTATLSAAIAYLGKSINGRQEAKASGRGRNRHACKFQSERMRGVEGLETLH